MSALEIETPRGLARAHVQPVKGARGALVLGHGAGGSVSAPDLVAVSRVAIESGFAVALVEQPYRVLVRRSPPPAPHLDEAWVAVVAALRAGPLEALPLITGGRSSGARVACRTAAASGAAGVLCLAFPLVAPRGTSRQEELDAVGVPALVVQGTTDRFGMVEPAGQVEVAQVRGDHGLKSDLPAVAAAVREWLARRPI